MLAHTSSVDDINNSVSEILTGGEVQFQDNTVSSMTEVIAPGALGALSGDTP